MGRKEPTPAASPCLLLYSRPGIAPKQPTCSRSNIGPTGTDPPMLDLLVRLRSVALHVRCLTLRQPIPYRLQTAVAGASPCLDRGSTADWLPSPYPRQLLRQRLLASSCPVPDRGLGMGGFLAEILSIHHPLLLPRRFPPGPTQRLQPGVVPSQRYRTRSHRMKLAHAPSPVPASTISSRLDHQHQQPIPLRGSHIFWHSDSRSWSKAQPMESTRPQSRRSLGPRAVYYSSL